MMLTPEQREAKAAGNRDGYTMRKERSELWSEDLREFYLSGFYQGRLGRVQSEENLRADINE